MPDVAELGRRVQAKHPGAYDDMDPAELGRRVRAKHPGAYDDFTDTAASPAAGGGGERSVLDQKRTPGESTKAFLEGAWSMANPMNLVKGAAQAVMHPIDTAGAMVDAHAATAGRAAESFGQGDYLQGLRHGINAILPLIGPQLDASQEKIRSGDVATGAGEIVGMAAAPKVLQGTARAAGAVAHGAKAAAQGAGGVAGAVVRGAVKHGVAKATGVPAPVVGAAGEALIEEMKRRGTGAAAPAPAPPAEVPPPAPAPPAPVAVEPVQASAPVGPPPEPPYVPATLDKKLVGLAPEVQQKMLAKRSAVTEPAAPAPEPPASKLKAAAKRIKAKETAAAEKLKPKAAAAAEPEKLAPAKIDEKLNDMLGKLRKMQDETPAPADAAPAKLKGAPAAEPTSEELVSLLEQSLAAVKAKKAPPASASVVGSHGVAALRSAAKKAKGGTETSPFGVRPLGREAESIADFPRFPIPKPDLSDASKIAYGDDYYRRVAEYVASKIPGGKIHESKSTNSFYVYSPALKTELRISDHQKYGVTLPTHINPNTKKGLAELIDRAIRAGVNGNRNYGHVKTWEDLYK